MSDWPQTVQCPCQVEWYRRFDFARCAQRERTTPGWRWVSAASSSRASGAQGDWNFASESLGSRVRRHGGNDDELARHAIAVAMPPLLDRLQVACAGARFDFVVEARPGQCDRTADERGIA